MKQAEIAGDGLGDVREVAADAQLLCEVAGAFKAVQKDAERIARGAAAVLDLSQEGELAKLAKRAAERSKLAKQATEHIAQAAGTAAFYPDPLEWLPLNVAALQGLARMRDAGKAEDVESEAGRRILWEEWTWRADGETVEGKGDALRRAAAGRLAADCAVCAAVAGMRSHVIRDRALERVKADVKVAEANLRTAEANLRTAKAEMKAAETTNASEDAIAKAQAAVTKAKEERAGTRKKLAETRKKLAKARESNEMGPVWGALIRADMGMTDEEIAKDMSISPSTVTRLFKKARDYAPNMAPPRKRGRRKSVEVDKTGLVEQVEQAEGKKYQWKRDSFYTHLDGEDEGEE